MTDVISQSRNQVIALLIIRNVLGFEEVAEGLQIHLKGERRLRRAASEVDVIVRIQVLWGKCYYTTSRETMKKAYS